MTNTLTKIRVEQTPDGKWRGLTDENYANVAEKHIQENQDADGFFVAKHPRTNHVTDKLTTSKIRTLLDLVNKIYSQLFYSDQETLSADLLSDIQYLKMKIAYEAGRDKSVKNMVDKTWIYKALATNHIKTKTEFLLYARYVESLVAYFKFYGGRDN